MRTQVVTALGRLAPRAQVHVMTLYSDQSLIQMIAVYCLMHLLFPRLGLQSVPLLNTRSRAVYSILFLRSLLGLTTMPSSNSP